MGEDINLMGKNAKNKTLFNYLLVLNNNFGLIFVIYT